MDSMEANFMAKARNGMVGVRWVVIASALLVCGGCSREPKQQSLTAVAYNYSETSFGSADVNGKWASAPLESVKPGDVNGGGSICCVKVEDNAKTARIRIEFIDGEYVGDVPIQQPWPPSGYERYLVIHVLPDRQVKLVVSAGRPWPRLDLLKARLNELEISDYTISSPDMWELGPELYVGEDQDAGN